MGQFDPLDGFVTYNELKAAAIRDLAEMPPLDLENEIADMAEICRGIGLTTDDPLGIGGLLFDASRIAQLMIRGYLKNAELLESVLNSALMGLEAFVMDETIDYPAEYRLAFRELGLSIGLSAVENLSKWIEKNPSLFSRESSVLEDLMEYMPLREKIERFWLDDKN